MHASSGMIANEPRLLGMSPCTMHPPADASDSSPSEPSAEVELKRSIRELLDVLPKDVVDELNGGTIDLKDPAFLDGLMDHVSRLSMANPASGRRILPKVMKLKKLISRSLRESDPDAAVSATVTRSGERIGRNDPCKCGSGKKYKQCCLRKQ